MLKKTALSMAVGVALLAGIGAAKADTITSLTVTGGDFAMGSPGVGACANGGFGNFQCLTAGSNPTITGGAMSSPSSITAFNFFNAPVTTFLAPSATGAANANDWGSGFTGGVNAGTIALNLGGFYAQWNGTNFLQGTDSAGTNGTSTNASGTVSGCVTSGLSTTCAFDVSWHSYITTAPFAGQTGYWHLTGSVTSVAAVPFRLPCGCWAPAWWAWWASPAVARTWSKLNSGTGAASRFSRPEST